jgi:hypothetical protein
MSSRRSSTAERLDPDVASPARTPEDRRVMVAGKLEMIRHSDRRFTLVLPAGEVLRGVASERVDISDLAGLFGKHVLVSGTVKFRPSGSVLRVEADHIEPASADDVAVFSSAPAPLVDDLDPHARSLPLGLGSGLAAIVGQWPGDETDEQILAALAELS